VKIDACVHYFTLTKMITPSHFSSWHFSRLSYWFSFVRLNWTPPGTSPFGGTSGVDLQLVN
jgi:hypothetical protein